MSYIQPGNTVKATISDIRHNITKFQQYEVIKCTRYNDALFHLDVYNDKGELERINSHYFIVVGDVFEETLSKLDDVEYEKDEAFIIKSAVKRWPVTLRVRTDDDGDKFIRFSQAGDHIAFDIGSIDSILEVLKLIKKNN